jgi:hypothetical protein
MATAADDGAQAFRRLLDVAAHGSDPKAALTDLAEAAVRAGDNGAALEALRRLFVFGEPKTPPWVIGVAQAGETDWRAVYRRTKGLLDSGAPTPDLVTQHLTAAAHAGQSDGVQRLLDFDRLLEEVDLDAPDGSPDFHARLASEIRAKLVYYEEPSDRAIRHAWRHNDVLATPTPAIQALRARLATQIERPPLRRS